MYVQRYFEQSGQRKITSQEFRFIIIYVYCRKKCRTTKQYALPHNNRVRLWKYKSINQSKFI